MGRPQQVTDAQIAEAARACFLEHGPQVSVQVVAARLGVSSAAVFARVASKEQLLMRAFFSGVPGPGRALAMLQSATTATTATTSTALRTELLAIMVELMAVVRQVVPGLVMISAAGLPLREVLRGSSSTALSPDPPTALRAALVAYLKRAHARGLRCPGEPTAFAEALLGPLEARAFHDHVLGDDKSAAADAVFCRRLLHGLWPVAPEKRRTTTRNV
jgi:AcrR family transcriptional regulator